MSQIQVYIKAIKNNIINISKSEIYSINKVGAKNDFCLIIIKYTEQGQLMTTIYAMCAIDGVIPPMLCVTTYFL